MSIRRLAAPWVLAFTLVAFAEPAALSAAPRHAYFTNQNAVQRVLIGDTEVETLIPEQVWPLAIALDAEGGKVYWTDANGPRILRANTDGTEVETLVSTEVTFPAGIALDLADGKMYWGDRDFPGVSRANLDGSDIEHIVPGVSALGVALDLGEGKVYWTEESLNVGRANLDGSDAEKIITELGSPNDLALDLDAGLVYVTDEPSKIVRANLDGTNLEVVMSDAGSNPFGIALDIDEGKMYWTDIATGVSRRSNLDGTEGEDLFPAAWSFGIALEWDAAPAAPVFIRGDSDSSGRPEITDAIYTLNALFLGGPLPGCQDAADSDDDGALGLTDAVYLLNYLFLAGKAPPSPGPDVCGADPTADALPPCTFDRDRCDPR